MLTPQFPWTDLVYELKVETAAQLVQHNNFPHSITNLSLTSVQGYALANEREVWKQALLLYFPGILPHKKAQATENPKALFIFLYQNIAPLLKKNHLLFSDFVASVLHQTPALTGNMSALQALRLIAGHPLLEVETPHQDMVEKALLFTAAMGNADFAEWHFEKQQTVFSPGILQQALHLAACSGHQRIFNLLLTHGNNAFDANLLRNALLAAALQGHTRIVASLLSPPYLRMVSFSLKKVVELAFIHNFPDLLTLLLRENQHLRFSSEIRKGVVEVAKNNQGAIIIKTYHLAAVHFNDTTICKIVSIAAAQGIKDLVIFFGSHPALLKSPSTILEAVRSAMQNKHGDIALYLLRNCRSSLRVYVKRDLLLLAVQLGQHEIVDDFIKHDDAKADLLFYENALSIALFHEDTETETILRKKLKALSPDKQNCHHNTDSIEQLTQAFSTMKVDSVDELLEPQNMYIPAYQRSPQLLRQSSSVKEPIEHNGLSPTFQ